MSQKLITTFILIFGIFAFTISCERHQRVEIKKVPVEDIEIAYYMRGNGPPLLMIMGFRGTMALWDPGLLEALEKHYTLILFDHRGVGFSTDTKEDHTTIHQMAEDTAHFIKALGFEKVHVLGWSMGSRIAQELAIRHPEILDRLILCAPNPGGHYQAHRHSKTYQQLTSFNLSLEQALPLLYPQTSEGRSAANSFVERLKRAVIGGSVPDDFNISNQTLERQIHALKLWDENNMHYEALSHLQIPTLVADGLEDVLDQPENARLVANQIPFAWAAYFQGAGHAFLSQDYANFAHLIVLFIESEKRSH